MENKGSSNIGSIHDFAAGVFFKTGPRRRSLTVQATVKSMVSRRARHPRTRVAGGLPGLLGRYAPGFGRSMSLENTVRNIESAEQLAQQIWTISSNQARIPFHNSIGLLHGSIRWRGHRSLTAPASLSCWWVTLPCCYCWLHPFVQPLTNCFISQFLNSFLTAPPMTISSRPILPEFLRRDD